MIPEIPEYGFNKHLSHLCDLILSSSSHLSSLSSAREEHSYSSRNKVLISDLSSLLLSSKSLLYLSCVLCDLDCRSDYVDLAKKKSSDEECLTFGSKDEEYAMAVRDFKKFFKRGGGFAKKKSSDEECLTFGSKDEEYAMAVRDFKKFFKRGGGFKVLYIRRLESSYWRCPKPPKDKNQRAFVGGSWSDSDEEDDEKVKNETCLVAQASSETSSLVDDDLDEEEAIKVTEKKNLENDLVGETLEIDEIVNIKESRNHPLENVIGNLNQRTLRSQAQNQIPQPRNMTIIGTKWVFKNKLEENGVVSRNKVRLLAQGYNQQEGIDYDETYTPVARLKSIRILLAYACALDFKLFQMDVKSAFLNGFINKVVYVTQPPGFIDFKKPDHVYKLKKALYCLKQSPKAWLDIMFSVCLCARFQEAPKISYLEKVKRIFRYIKGTTHLGLWYPKGTSIETVVYVDSDHAGDYVDRKSTSGICTFVRCCLTSWFLKKQIALAIFTTKAEYVSAGKACQQALLMKQALINYDIRLDDVPIMCDNKGAIDLSKNPVKSTCYIRDLKGNDLLTGSRGTDLYSITLQDTNCLNPICLMAKASSSQAWLWLNDIVVGLPKLKFLKVHLCSSYELGKAKRNPFHTKLTPSSKRRLQLLHMDLCGPMWVASINGKKYVLVIVDDYSRYTWTYFLRSNDETPKVLINFLRLVQRGLQAQANTIHVNFDELPQMASDHVSSDPAPECQRMALEHDSLILAIQRQANVPQADRIVTTSNELDLLFSLMFDELLNGSSKVVSKTSDVSSVDAPNQRQQHTTPLNNHTTPTPTCQVPTLAPTVTSSENINQAETYAEDDQVADDGFINIFCTPVQERGEMSSRHVDSSNMHTFYQRYPSEHLWIKDHPLEQVIGNPSQSIRTRCQLESNAEMYMFVLTVSQTEPKNIKEAMADSAWIESMQEELHQFDRLDVWELVDRPL
nr:copia protein [Tanacetum cinerariifolium]